LIQINGDHGKAGLAIRVATPRLVTCSSPVYGWFTEGFDTADLREAKALLDELA
jgi:hypothetical protein